ncbi:MAG: hypothetical protein U0232_05905 [Thermomicrobiales bacterium]
MLGLIDSAAAGRLVGLACNNESQHLDLARRQPSGVATGRSGARRVRELRREGIGAGEAGRAARA